MVGITIMKMRFKQTVERKRCWREGITLVGCAILIAGMQSSCSTASSVAWQKIQEEGLIPYMVEHSSSDMPEIQLQEEPWGIADGASLVAGIGDADAETLVQEDSAVFTAQAVTGKPGFVYSPHSQTPLEIDVRGYRVGESVRCPYTEKIFIVPSGVDADLERTSPVAAIDGVVTRGSEAQLMVMVEEREPRHELEPDPKEKVDTTSENEARLLREIALSEEISVANRPAPERKPRKSGKGEPGGDELLAPPVDAVVAVPEARHVPGKPNYVFSPFAASNQVVDVEGHAPGSKVKCPYSGKIFVIPSVAEPSEG